MLRQFKFASFSIHVCFRVIQRSKCRTFQIGTSKISQRNNCCWKVYYNKKFSNLSDLVELENSLLKISRRQTKTNSICNSEFWTFKDGACRWLIITYQPYLQKISFLTELGLAPPIPNLGVRASHTVWSIWPFHKCKGPWGHNQNYFPHWLFARGIAPN